MDRNFVADFLIEVQFFSYSSGNLRETYAVRLKNVGKVMVDFLSVIIEFFSIALATKA